MKAPIILTFTLFNLGLVVFTSLRPAAATHTPPVPREATEPVVRPATVVVPSSKLAAKARPSAAPGAGSTRFHWSQLEAADYAAYLQNLRGVGCPEQTIRDIILADVRALYDQKAAAARPVPAAEFWRPSFHRPPLSSAARTALTALANEEQALLTQLLGGHWAPRALTDAEDVGNESGLRVEGPLAHKGAALQTWQLKYAALDDAVHSGAVGRDLTEAEIAQLDAIAAAREAELAKLLTPAEREEFDLRNSDQAMELRDRMIGFEVSEVEFRALYRLEQERAQRLPTLPADQALAAEAQFAAAAAKVLGPDRHAWFAAAGDANFRELHEISQRHDLPLDRLASAYQQYQATARQIEQLADQENLSESQRRERANQLVATLEQQVQVALGSAAFRSYAGTALREGLLDRL